MAIEQTQTKFVNVMLLMVALNVNAVVKIFLFNGVKMSQKWYLSPCKTKKVTLPLRQR